jgi:hypothetical protein
MLSPPDVPAGCVTRGDYAGLRDEFGGRDTIWPLSKQSDQGTFGGRARPSLDAVFRFVPVARVIPRGGQRGRCSAQLRVGAVTTGKLRLD